MDEFSLIEFSGKFRDLRQLERDYILVCLLNEIYLHFDNRLIFKGGTALKYFYNLNRFSEDLDFSYTDTNDVSLIISKIKKVFDNFNKQYPIIEIENRTRKEKGKVVGINYILRIRGPLNNKLNHLQNINIDISVRNDVIKKPELKYFSPIYSDIPVFSVPLMEIHEIMAEKVSAISERTKMRDIYDLYFLIFIKNISYNEKLTVEKMQKRELVFKREKILEKLKNAENKMVWKSELSYLIDNLPDNLEVVSRLSKLFEK